MRRARYDPVTMTPEELVQTVSPKIGALGSAFYFNPDTLAKGKELGLDGFRFYFLGRGGVLGDVEAPVVQSAFGYFHSDLVTKIWNSAREKMAPRDAARVYMQCCTDLGRSKLTDVKGLDSFCAAAQKVVAAADPAALALFAGIAAEPLAEDLPGRAMQLVAVLRELRGSAHLVAVRAVGIEPGVAHGIKRPEMVESFGYAECPPATEEDHRKLEAAEKLTDDIVKPAFAVLSDAEAQALVDGVNAIEQALA